MDILFRELGVGELGLVADLARRIWPDVYRGMISREQVGYMLREMNSEEALVDAVERRGERFWLIEVGGEGIGYFAIEPRGAGVVFLDKLYLLPEFHGMGIGTRALGEVERVARGAGAREVRLRVNRHNAGAIACYERNGYGVIGERCSGIGGGFVMDDYVMRLSLGG